MASKGNPGLGVVAQWRGLGTKVLAGRAITFLADIVLGIQVSTFSVYARNAGAAIALIGLVGTVAAVFLATGCVLSAGFAIFAGGNIWLRLGRESPIDAEGPIVESGSLAR